MLIDLLFLELIGEEKLKEQKEKSLPRFSYRYFSLSLHTNKKVATKQQCIKNYIMELNNLYCGTFGRDLWQQDCGERRAFSPDGFKTV